MVPAIRYEEILNETTGSSLERDEFAGRRCVALSILVQKDEGPSLSLVGPPGLAVFL